MKIIWTRDSVCMGDDVNAPNTRTEEVDHPLTVSDLLDRAADYVPHVSGSVWVVRVEDVVAGYLEMSFSGYLQRDEAALKELPPPKPRKSFLRRSTDTLHVHCVHYYTGSFCYYKKEQDGSLSLVEKFPEYTALMDKVKAALKTV